MSGTPTAETQAADDDAFVAEALGRFEQQWLPAQMQDNNALALANAWGDCDNMLSRFARGDPITSDYSDFRSGIWTQQDRLKDWGKQLGFPHMLDPNDHGPLDPRLTVPRLTQGAFDFLDDIVKTVEGPSKTERVAETSHGGFANKPTTSRVEEPNEGDKPCGEKSRVKSDSQQTQFRNLTTKDDHEPDVKRLDDKDHLRGMLRITVVRDKNVADATLRWEDVNSKDAQEKQQEMEYVKPIHPSWSDLSDWERNSQPTSKGGDTHNTAGVIPSHSIGQFVEWLDELQQRKALPENITEQSTIEYMQKLLGPANTQHINAPTYDLDHQIQDLLVTLDRVEMFSNYNEAVSPAKMWLSGDPMRSEMLFQMIVAYELKLRLEKTTTNFTMSNQVMAAMEMAGRWIEGVYIKNVSGPEYEPYYDFEELVHDEQIEGLVRFAELMEWPGLDEIQEFLEPRGATVLPSAMGTHKLLDWAFGTVLPGSGHVCTIMPALVLATPSLLRMGEPAHPSAGLVLNGRSYWRSKHVLGRVFGGIKDIKAANGWVGPCPPVLPNDGQLVRPGWWRIQEKDMPFDQVPKETAETSNLQGSDTPVKWVGAIPSRNSPTKIKFMGLQFLRAKAVDPRDVVDEPRRAVLTFKINKAPIASILELKHNPTFVAAPRCIDGPHLIDLGDLPRLENVVDVADIGGPFKSVPEDERVLVIDATGEGDCEILARAWCSMEGRHAVIARAAEGTCFTCAVRAAGSQGLALGCLIWV
ncbi:hypothetical protein NCS52_00695100 [Fusarium sp. LHS14.1]|nr:hypothetical protein NCS52_00695100 [Fusarium sp. LHS14.1]